MSKSLTIVKVFGDTHDLEDYLKANGLWYAARLRCWCTLCSLEKARQLLDEMPGRPGMGHSVLVTEEEGRLIVTVLLED